MRQPARGRAEPIDVLVPYPHRDLLYELDIEMDAQTPDGGLLMSRFGQTTVVKPASIAQASATLVECEPWHHNPLAI